MYERLRPPGFHAGSSCSEGPVVGEEGGCGVDIFEVKSSEAMMIHLFS